MPSLDRPVDRLAAGLLGSTAAFYTAINLYRLAHFYPLDFDLAIFGQGVWLLSRGATPFVTIQGMNLFGEHATWIHLPVALFYALLGSRAGVWLLVVLQSVALGGAGVLLYRHARREIAPGLAILVLASYLVYPALQHTWLEYYQPINLAVPCLLAATLAVREGRDRAALAWSLVALLTIENVAATVAAIAIYAVARGRRRLGLVLFGLVGVYLLILLYVLFPSLSERGYLFGDRLYGDFARSGPEAALYLAHPEHLADRLATAANGRYLVGLLAPVAFLPLASPLFLALAAQLPLNLVASWPYAHEIRYHYVAPIVPFVFLALVRTLAACSSRPWLRRLAVAALVAGAAVGQCLHASPWVWPRDGQRWWRGRDEDARERREVQQLLREIRAAGSISAHYRFLPALCERRRLFMFPDLGPQGTLPDYILVDRPRLQAHLDEATVLQGVRKLGNYFLVGETSTGTVLLFRGIGAPLPAYRGDASGAGRPVARAEASQARRALAAFA